MLNSKNTQKILKDLNLSWPLAFQSLVGGGFYYDLILILLKFGKRLGMLAQQAGTEQPVMRR